MYKKQWYMLKPLAITLSYKKMHVYTRHLREIFRNVKKTALKAQLYIAFPAKAPRASHRVSGLKVRRK